MFGWFRPKHVHRWRLESKTVDIYRHTDLLYHCATCGEFRKEHMNGIEATDMGPRSTELDIEPPPTVH